MSKILGYYDDQMQPHQRVIPDDWAGRVQAKLDAKQGIQTKDSLIPYDKIFTQNLLDEGDWTPEFIALVTPAPKDSNFNSYRNQEWYLKGQTGRIRGNQAS